MKKQLAIGVASVVVMTASLLGASGASAAVEFGDNCSATSAVPEYTLTALASSGGALPLTAPSSGVITKLKISTGIALPISIPLSVKTLRPAGGNNFTVVGQSTATATTGTTATDARIPVQAGDRLGMHGLPFIYEGSPNPGLAFYCASPSASLGTSPSGSGNPQPGATVAFTAIGPASVPIVAVLEADADGDGYGDETQDKCPQSAAVQTECPVVMLSAFSVVGGSSVSVLVATSIDAPVKVTGTVKLGKAGKVKLSAKTKTVTAGKIASFKLKFPQKLKEALKELGPGEKLKLKIVASATNVAGQVSADKLTAKLKGTG